MSKNIEWTMDKLASLGIVSLRYILGKMRNEEASVRFGTTGTGTYPNYQVKFSNGVVMTYQSKSHEKYSGADVFTDSNLSNDFSYSEILEAMKKA